MKKMAIIGAGLSGLSIAHLLKDHAQITVFEKARGVSGRMSTRRAEPYFFDHGAQYFTARTQAFQDFIQPLIEQGIIQRWSPRYVKLDGSQIIARANWIDEEPRYVGVPEMNQVAKYFAAGKHILLNTKIRSLAHNGKWQLTDEQGQQYHDFDWVISAIPSPQALELLPQSFKYYSDIQAIKMRACFAVMLGFKQKIQLDFEAAHVINSDLSWIAVNSHKPRRADYFTLVLHSSENFAEAHIDTDREKIMQHLMAEASRIVGQDVSMAEYKNIHGWLYANNYQRESYLPLIDQDHQLAACGDWCLGGRVEGAFNAAYNLVQAIKLKKI
jgi:renalase